MSTNKLASKNIKNFTWLAYKTRLKKVAFFICAPPGSDVHDVVVILVEEVVVDFTFLKMNVKRIITALGLRFM